MRRAPTFNNRSSRAGEPVDRELIGFQSRRAHVVRININQAPPLGEISRSLLMPYIRPAIDKLRVRVCIRYPRSQAHARDGHGRINRPVDATTRG